jgi:hypothetical protein
MTHSFTGSFSEPNKYNTNQGRDMLNFKIIASILGRSVLGYDRSGALSSPRCRM